MLYAMLKAANQALFLDPVIWPILTYPQPQTVWCATLSRDPRLPHYLHLPQWVPRDPFQAQSECSPCYWGYGRVETAGTKPWPCDAGTYWGPCGQHTPIPFFRSVIHASPRGPTSTLPRSLTPDAKDVRYSTKYLDSNGTWGILGRGKGLIGRIQDECSKVVQGGYCQVTHAPSLPRRNFWEYVEEELFQDGFAVVYEDLSKSGFVPWSAGLMLQSAWSAVKWNRVSVKTCYTTWCITC